MWRQRRLIRAETAAVALAIQPKRIASDVSQELGTYSGVRLTEAELVPFDPGQVTWCEGVIAEFEKLDEYDLKTINAQAPLIYRQVKLDADSDDETIEEHLAAFEKGLSGYITELVRWCRKELETARIRPKVLELANQFRARNLVLPAHALQLFTRYQTMLDNQLYKALHAFREVQEWRLKRMESEGEAACAGAVENAA
jgi:hypothetical protein